MPMHIYEEPNVNKYTNVFFFSNDMFWYSLLLSGDFPSFVVKFYSGFISNLILL